MSKSEKTELLESKLLSLFKDKVFCCPEVTIGWNGKERVDFMTYDTKGIFRCFEVKSSKEDFYSKSKHTFVGHYGYYVVPIELFDIVKKDIPKHIGCYILDERGNMYSNKKATKQPLKVTKTVLYESFIRSLYRESLKYIVDTRDKDIKWLRAEVRKLEKNVKFHNKSLNEYNKLIREYRNFIIKNHGTKIADEIEEEF